MSSLSDELTTARLVLPLITAEHVAAVSSGERRPDWAPDFPASGDLEIAGFLHRAGLPTGPAAAFSPRLVRERDTGLVVGGAGFLGPPESGRVELGYGIVPSRRRRGYATEAAAALAAAAWSDPAVKEVFALVEPDNPASAGVLLKAGFQPTGSEGGHSRYAVRRPA